MSLGALAAWRRRQEACSEVLPFTDDAEDRVNGSSLGTEAVTNGSRDRGTDHSVGSNQTTSALTIHLRESAASRPIDEAGDVIALPAPATPAEQSAGLQKLLELAQPFKRATRKKRFRPSQPLLIILTVQAVLSAQLIRANTAFEDEALYLWAGHQEWAHLFHHVPIPPFPTYFSGAPVIYPPLAALADSVGGLAGARLLSLCFMLGATMLLWKVTDRLYGRRTAFFAAGLWAILGPTQRLGAFATYDAMALFFIALATWCVTSGRGQRDATRWMLAGACALVLANATKYASALFDPTVVALAFLTGYPPGRKIARRRIAYLVAVMVAAIIVLLQIGGGWYVVGIDQTTLTRHYGGTLVSVVLQSCWDWTAVVIVVAALAVMISFKSEKTAPGRWLLAVLAATALLVPIEQARIHTYTSLSKHVDFGVWFAAIAAGYAADRVISWLRSRSMQTIATGAFAAALIPVVAIGMAQANSFFAWPGAANLIPVAKRLTAHGGRFLADNAPPLEYYLPKTSWRQWSSVYGITLPSGRREAEKGNAFGPYRSLLATHYFAVIILAFTDKPLLDDSIAAYLQTDKSYRFVGAIPFSNPGTHGSYVVWAYRGAP